jgi:glutamate/tyrosine decarboxylase-like PLP-dependent enzyme
MGCGVVLFRSAQLAQAIRKTASYIIRTESFDAGKFSAEGSRAANVVYLHASLSLIGAAGFEALLDRSAALVHALAERLRDMPDFEVVFPPTTNVLLYRWIPPAYRARVAAGILTADDHAAITAANRELQALQTARGDGFVSRTTIYAPAYGQSLGVLRIVIANPLVTPAHLHRVLREQLDLAATLTPAPCA